MPKGRTHTAEQIIRALREVDSGAPVGFVCRQLGIVEKTFYRWREVRRDGAKRSSPTP